MFSRTSEIRSVFWLDEGVFGAAVDFTVDAELEPTVGCGAVAGIVPSGAGVVVCGGWLFVTGGTSLQLPHSLSPKYL